jgi:hypothetical protein
MEKCQPKKINILPFSCTQSHYLEVAHFYGAEYEIWAGFGAVGSTEKTIWSNYE